MKKGVGFNDNIPLAIPSEHNAYTVAGYESCTLHYANSTVPEADGDAPRGLRELLNAVDVDARILEIGSGPGWDADWLEANGMQVSRTDATEAFVNFQNSRGKCAERVDVLKDRLGGPYDAIIALYVLQHIDRSVLPVVFAKLSHALRTGGSFLFSIREGHGEVVERGTKGGSYYIAQWQRSELVAELVPLGFSLHWTESFEDTEGKWLNLLFKKSQQSTNTVQ
jgi:SAM-dependent methyltransferase